MSKVPFFDYSRIFRDHETEYLKVIKEIGYQGGYILQKELKEFEESAAKFIGAKFALGVGNATDGLEMIWQAIGIKAGDEVIVSAHTMVATASAIKSRGATPIPVDILENGLIDPTSIRNAINEKTVAICPTQLNGHICNMKEISNLASEFNLLIVEDAAQAFGANQNGKFAGLFGVAGAYSFYPAKNLGALGDAGLIATNDEEVFKKIRAIRDHGRDENGEIITWGRNSRLDNLQAAILQKQLNNYLETISIRRNLAQLYDNLLSNVTEINITHKNIGDTFSVFQNYEVCVNDREGLIKFLKSKNIGTLVPWGGQTINKLDNLGINIPLSRVDEYFTQCLLLPLNLFINEQDVHYVVDSIKEYYSRKK